jgi:hypothetical protein
VTSADGREGGLERYRWRRELGAVGRPAPGSRHASRPSGRRCATSGASRGRRGAGPRSPARSRRKGCTRPSRPVSAGFTVDAPKATLAMQSSYRRGTRPWGRDRRGAGAASPIADAAKRRSVAARCSRKILPCAPAAQFILSLRTGPRSNYACARGREGNEAFIVGDYRGEYWR